MAWERVAVFEGEVISDAIVREGVSGLGGDNWWWR